LQKLAIAYVTIPEGDLIRCLQIISSSLVEFSYHCLGFQTKFPIGEKTLKLLTYKDTKDGGNSLCLCPNLRRINFSASTRSQDGILADMIISRCSPTVVQGHSQIKSRIMPLESITCDYNSNIRIAHAIDASLLTEMQYNGALKIRLSGTDDCIMLIWQAGEMLIMRTPAVPLFAQRYDEWKSGQGWEVEG
jgi:hypothetical protein